MRETIQFGHGAGQHPDADQLSAFVEHALPVHEREEMLAHLAVCGECRATIRLSQAAVEEVAEPVKYPVEKPSRTPWFVGWGVVWPAAAALAAVVVLVLYIRHDSLTGRKANEPAQLAESHVPARPAVNAGDVSKPARALDKKTTPAEREGGLAGAVGATPRQNLDAKKAIGAQVRAVGGPLPSNATAATESFLGSAATMVRPPSPVAAPSMAAAQAPVAGAMNESPAAPNAGSAWIGNGATGGSDLKKAEAARAEVSLPSGLAVLSLATHGRQVVAIDARNGVFASADGGEHWTAVPTVWTGRAVKADLASYGMIGGAAVAGGRMAEFASVNRETSPQRQESSTPVQTVNQNVATLQIQGRDAAAQAQRAPAPAQNLEQNAAPQISSGQLTGTVKDVSGAAVPGAKVTVTDSASHTTQTATTGADGRYVLDRLTPGSYDLKTQAAGFEQQTTKGVDVRQSQTNVADVALQVGVATQTVTVEASEADALEPQSMTLSQASVRKPKVNRAPKIEAAVPAPVFEITTDNGDKWTSADGMTWKRK
jgi:hypothetical protein